MSEIIYFKIRTIKPSSDSWTDIWVSLVTQTVKNPPAMGETWVQSLGWEDPLEKDMATHSSILAWRLPWTEEPGGYNPLGRKESDMPEWLSPAQLSKIIVTVLKDSASDPLMMKVCNRVVQIGENRSSQRPQISLGERAKKEPWRPANFIASNIIRAVTWGNQGEGRKAANNTEGPKFPELYSEH